MRRLAVLRRYWKSIIGTGTAIGVTTMQSIQTQLSNTRWGWANTLVVLIAFMGALGVYVKANEPGPGASDAATPPQPQPEPYNGPPVITPPPSPAPTPEPAPPLNVNDDSQTESTVIDSEAS